MFLGMLLQKSIIPINLQETVSKLTANENIFRAFVSRFLSIFLGPSSFFCIAFVHFPFCLYSRFSLMTNAMSVHNVRVTPIHTAKNVLLLYVNGSDGWCK